MQSVSSELSEIFSILIEKTKKIYLFELDDDSKKNMTKLLDNFIQQKICIMIIGETSSGKTTLMNCLISYDNNEKKFKPEYLNLLPTDVRENTSYIWILESSPNESFYLQENYQLPIKYSKDNFENFQKEIKLLNEQQKKEVNIMKSNEFSYIPKIISIKIPGFDPNLRLIDFAGVSSQKVKSSLSRFFSNEMACLFYVKDLNSPEDIKENIISFIADIHKLDKEENFDDIHILFSIIFTKKDKFFKIEEEEKYNIYDIEDGKNVKDPEKKN